MHPFLRAAHAIRNTSSVRWPVRHGTLISGLAASLAIRARPRV
jgi:hypothetical protein